MPAISERQQVVLDAVGFDWTPFTAIIPTVRRRLRMPSHHAAEMAVHRALDELQVIGRVEVKTEDRLRFTRWKQRDAA